MRSFLADGVRGHRRGHLGGAARRTGLDSVHEHAGELRAAQVAAPSAKPAVGGVDRGAILKYLQRTFLPERIVVAAAGNEVKVPP